MTRDEVIKQLDMMTYKNKLDIELDLIGTLFQNGWLNNEGVEGACDYASIEINDMIQYLQKADWFQDRQDKEKLLELIEEAM
mgnify:CR=1 FL=1|jgi:hypothetical protein